jgi:L-threonylcarbamoyladenylate synthase
MAEIIRWPASTQEQAAIAQHAADVIRRGGLVVYPTDTVYGLGCDPANADAVRRIYAVKGRPDEKAIVWLVRSIDDARAWCDVDERAERLAAAFWPGALTIVLRKLKANAGELPTLGVRAPAHPAALAIIDAAGGTVATTSANRSGESSARTADEADAAIGALIDLIIDAGPSPVGTESTVVDLSAAGLTILRLGALSLELIEHALQDR